MSMVGGQSLIPYPYKERRKFNDSRRIISPIVKFTTFLAWLATIASPPSWLFWMWSKFAYRHYNDSWRKRGLILIFLGAALALLLVPSIIAIPEAWYVFMTSFAAASTVEPVSAAISAMLLTSPYALILQGLHALARSFQVERTTDAFLKPQHPTPMMRVRRKLNTRKLTLGREKKTREGEGYVRFGVIVGDRIPWRHTRYGMIVERKIKKMGHGVIIGANGTGKTKMAETFTHYILKNDSAMIYIDFKASLGTLHGLAAVAHENGRPCHILDIGFGTTDTSWYDLFDWPGSPADKASVLVECFQFAEGQDGAAYYRGIAEAWLPMQIEAAERIGLAEGEGMFDFLLDTSVPRRFKERITALRDSESKSDQEKFEKWDAEANNVKATDLQGLRNELNKIINAAGHRLKPNAENPNPVSMKEVMDNGGLVYIGIASGINDVVVKVLGSFLFKELSILVSSRSRVSNPDSLRDVFVIPDEASEMEERSVVMNPIYTMAREARVFIWPSFQSFAVWDESTQEEIQSNARNFVAFSIPSRDTAEKISSTLPDIFALHQMQQEETKQQSFQNQTIGISGDTRLSVATDAFLRPNMELSDIDVYHAYLWFKDASGISRTKWRGRRRVRKDENRGDAPLVKLVPYDLVMPHNLGDETELISDTPQAPEAIQLPSAERSTDSPAITSRRERVDDSTGEESPKSKSTGSWEDYIVASPDPQSSGPIQLAAGNEETASEPDVEPDIPSRATLDDAPTEAPAMPSFASRGARKRKDESPEMSAAAVSPEATRSEEALGADGGDPAPPDTPDAPTDETAASPPAPSVPFPNPWEDEEFTEDGQDATPTNNSLEVEENTAEGDGDVGFPATANGADEETEEFAEDGVAPSSAPEGSERGSHSVVSEGADTKDVSDQDDSEGGSRDEEAVAPDDPNRWIV